MPLDTGAIVENLDALRAGRAGHGSAPNLNASGSLGDVLRAARLYRGFDLNELSRITRVRTNYLEAIEEMRLDQLPSRPFALGFVRAYALAVGLDPDLAAARLKVEDPDGAKPLEAPMGVRRESDPRLKLLGIGGAAVLAAIIAWNVVQHAFAHNAPTHPGVEVAGGPARPAAASSAPLALGAPLPAPMESTTPPPYVTPGLASAAPVSAQDAAALAAANPTLPVGSPFTPGGPIYGVPASQSNVVLQARKSASLVVHGAGGSVYFARQLAAGESYRAPQIKGLTIDVSEPEKFNLYIGGALKGPLTGASISTIQGAG